MPKYVRGVFVMWKKILLSIGLIILLIVGIEIFSVSQSKENKAENTNIVQNEIEISSEYVTDDCVNEWEDYSKTVQEEIKETGQNLNDENKQYILRENDGFINVYYINEKGEEILYRVTDISTKYLGEEDVKELQEGINVVGIQELNQLLEDFE